MRSYIVFVLLLILLIGFGALLGIRERPEHETPAVAATARPAAPDGGSADAGAPPRQATPDAGGAREARAAKRAPDAAPAKGTPPANRGGDASAGAGDAQPAASPPEKLMDRPLRVIGLGWDLIAPGVVANRGTIPGENSRYTKAGLEVHLRSSSKVVELERALARGGADELGADVAVMPLPVFVASYEQLRALSPKVFFVFGWSHGHEALMSFRDDPLLDLRKNRDVQLLVERGTPAHFFGLFLLDLAGVRPDAVEEVDRGARVADSIDLAALRQAARGQPAGAASRRFVLTTADASRLIPYVAVAPAGLIDGEAAALEVLCEEWLAGVDELRRDVPTAARRIASIRGAPEALELLGSMGRVESATLRENAEVAGLSGRGAVTLAALIAQTWRLFRGADVVTSPLPDGMPVDSAVVAAMVRAGSAMTDGPGGTLGDSEASRGAASGASDTRPLIVHRIEDRRFEDEQLVARVGFLAGVFRPLPIRVAIPARDTSRADRVIEAARARFALPEDRLTAARRVTGRNAPAAIEILPPL